MMTNLIIGIIIIVATNILTAIICILNAKDIINEQHELYNNIIDRRDDEVNRLYNELWNIKHNVGKCNTELKFNKD